MAIGWSPKHELSFLIDSLSEGEALILALETASALNWKFSLLRRTGFVAHSKISFLSWGEEINVELANRTLFIQSKCSGSQFIDWGKNKTNIEKFITVFNKLKTQISKEELNQKLQEYKTNVKEK